MRCFTAPLLLALPSIVSSERNICAPEGFIAKYDGTNCKTTAENGNCDYDDPDYAVNGHVPSHCAECGCEESDYTISTWHGETDIADWTAVGGNGVYYGHESGGYQAMFDNDISTLWLGNNHEDNKVIITFKKHVMFYDLRIIARSTTNKNYFENSYKSMCVVLDDNVLDEWGDDMKICTSADNDVESGEEIIFHVPKHRISAKKVELLIQPDEFAQIADLKIHYIEKTSCAPDGWFDEEGEDCEEFKLNESEACAGTTSVFDYYHYENEGYVPAHCKQCGCVEEESGRVVTMNIKITLSTAYTEELADPISQEYKDLSTTLISVYEKEMGYIKSYYAVNYEIKGVTFTGGSDGTNAVLTVEFTSDETDINAAILKGFVSYYIKLAISLGSFLNIGEDKTVEVTEGLWSAWSPPGACSETCGDGMITKTRVCDGEGCPGADAEQTACNLKECQTASCPDNYKITGLKNDVLNNVFYANGRTIFGRPMYMSLNGVNGIWWDGEDGDLGDWMLGSAKNVDDGKLLTGWVSSNTQTNCPLFDNESSETWNNVWQPTPDVIFTVPDNECADDVTITGMTLKVLNGNYKRNGKLVHGRQVFDQEDGDNSIWFNGQSGVMADWMIGQSTNVEEGKFSYGSVASNSDPFCPSFLNMAKEYWNNKWQLIGSHETPEVVDCEVGKCSQLCGGGKKTCQRQCLNGVFGQDVACQSADETKEEDCNTQACQVCLENFELVNGVCVQVFCGSPMTWYGARDACVAKNAILAPINDAETNKLIAESTVVASGKLWIGRTDEETEGTWTNVLGDSVKYSNWHPKNNQPDNHNHLSPEHYKGGENCAIMNWDYISPDTLGKWADFPCNHLQDCFACQLVEECSKGLVFKDGKCQKASNPCPGSAGGEAHICWDYNAGTDACTFNTNTCRTSLTCSKTAMTITFDKYLFGTENDSPKTAFSTIGTCLTESAPRTDGSFTWTGGFGDCGMEIATEDSFITMKKTLSIGNTDSGITLGGTKIYASGGKTTTVEFKCKYASSATATSDDIDIQAPVDVSASVTEAKGSFATGLSLKHYTDANYNAELTTPIAIGSIVFPMITWEVTTSKIGFYIENCYVIDVTNVDVPNDDDPRIPIILNTCYAGVVSAAISPDRASGLFNHKKVKFSYRSFSFDTASADQQKISCTVQFCTTTTDGSRACTGDDYIGAKPVVDVSKCPSSTQFNYAL